MKKILLFAAVAAALACGCEKSQSVKDDVVAGSRKEAVLKFSLSLSSSVTKSGDIGAKDYETKVNSAQVFVFDAGTGRIDKIFAIGTSMKGSVSTTLGAKTVWAIVNPPLDYSYVATESELKSICVGLSDNSVSGNWFVMAGHAETELAAGGGTVDISVRRIAARVCLKKLSVDLPAKYQEVEFCYLYLANVKEYADFEFSPAASSYINWQGRNTGKIIDGSTAEAEVSELTAFKPSATIGNGSSFEPETPVLLYAMPNESTTEPSGYDSDAEDFKTTLVAVVKIEGKTYYYPVVLNSSPIKSNESYTVSMTIASLGSDDPNKPVEKSALNVELSVESWAAGAEYNEVI